METLVDLARDLIERPSHEDASAVGERIADWLRAETAAAVRQDDAGNVFATGRLGAEDDGRSAHAPKPDLALVGHHDTVPPAERQLADDGSCTVTVADGRLHGRGSADMKGALAAAMVGFRDACAGDGDRSSPSQRTIGFASFVDEEVGGLGAQQAIEDGYAPDRAVVIEGSTGYSAPGVTDVAVAHRGRVESRLVASGTAEHAAEASPGENAIYRLAGALDRVRDLPLPEGTVPLGPDRTMTASLTPTVVESGTTPNATPATAQATIDERTVPGSAARAALDTVTDVDGVDIETVSEHPAMACGDAAFVDRCIEAARNAAADRQRDPERVVKPHATDAGWLARAGTEPVVIGPAEPGEAHTPDESVSIDALDRCRRIYERVLLGPR
jgi:acetylornithine deacetylase